ncbi:MAG: HAD-IIIC family phosphatase [Anaerolineae bacterium]|nr:HAD-IIIC family phosphatase [Anaerolineae bacterium]
MVLVPTWTSPYYQRGMGILDWQRDNGVSYPLARMNLALADAFVGSKNIFVLDAQRWFTAVGKRSADPKLWFLGKVAYGMEVLKYAAADIRAAWRALNGLTRKVVAVDLDDTLWGGIVGDDENIVIGGHDPIGEAYAQVQTILKTYKARGVLLTIVSKNQESTALRTIREHSEMILRPDDFVAWRINWQDKAENIAELAQELKLGLDAFVFLDDNPVERSRVRQALPEVLVPELPLDKLLLPQALLELDYFDTSRLTDEDRQRADLYTMEKQRGISKSGAGSLQDWLMSLELRVRVEPLNDSNASRATQLLNKTNQLNLTTRRLSETELRAWSDEPDHHVLVFRVADRFGESGLTGLASVRAEHETAYIDDFVLSCRVMGRGVERTMLCALSELAKRAGAKQLVAIYRPTGRNEPCHEFFKNESGMSADATNRTFRWNLENNYPLPAHVQLQLAGPSPA